MAEEIKRVVLDIETRFNGKGAEQVQTQLDKTETTANKLEKAFDNAAKSVEELNKKKLDAFYDRFFKSKKAVDETSKSLGFLTGISNKVKDSFSAVSDKFKSFSDKITAFKNSSPIIGKAFDIIKEGASAFGGSLLKLAGPLAGTVGGLGAIVAVPIGAFFTKTKEGAEFLAETLGGFKNIYENFSQGLAKIGEGLIKLDFSKIKEGASDFFASFSKDVYEAGVQLERFKSEVEDNIIVGNIQAAQLEERAKRNEAILAKEATKFEDLLEKQGALNQLTLDYQQLGIIRVNTAKSLLDIEVKRIAAETKLTEEQVRRADPFQFAKENRDALLKAQIAYNNALKENETANKRLFNLEDVLNRDRERLFSEQDKANKKRQEESEKAAKDRQKRANEFIDIIKTLEEKIKELEISDPLGLEKIENQTDLTNLKDKVIKSFNELEDIIKKSSQLLGINDLFALKPDDISKLEKELGLSFGSIFKAISSTVQIEGILSEALKRELEVFNVSPLTVKINPVISKTDISSQIEAAKQVTQIKPIGSLTDEEKQQVKEGLNFVKDQLTAGLNAFYEAEISKTDFLISEQERRIEETNKLAELGNAEQLQLEQERLNNLLEERQKAVEQQKALNAIEIVSTTALNAAKYATVLLDESIKTTPVVAIVQGLALLASIAAGISQISALSQGFEGGVDVLTPNSKSRRGKTDTIPAWLAPGERVVPAQLNKDLGGIRNQDLPMLVAAGKMLLGGYGQWNSDKTFESGTFPKEALELLRDQNRAIKEIPFAIQDQLIDINFDYSGYTIQQRRQSRYAQKVQSLRR